MQSQRVIDGEHQDILRENKREERKFGGLKSKNKRSAAPVGTKKNKWLKESESFRNAMRAARGAKPLANEYGGGSYGAGASPPEDNDGFIK
mmetsp:Transcript_27079/g.23933  ORF Transcript_27079/g.23933 Transcript_27079/m.23933 type:complete len:91 (-) Transcript_27079:162-434(-)